MAEMEQGNPREITEIELAAFYQRERELMLEKQRLDQERRELKERVRAAGNVYRGGMHAFVKGEALTVQIESEPALSPAARAVIFDSKAA